MMRHILLYAVLPEVTPESIDSLLCTEEDALGLLLLSIYTVSFYRQPPHALYIIWIPCYYISSQSDFSLLEDINRIAGWVNCY